MKIISGKYSKRNIEVVGKTRPPLMRIRQSIFDMLDPSGMIVLDLCAGSGSFGLESLSRGAKFVYFMEENITTARNLLSTISTWGEQNAKVIMKNVKYLPQTEVKVDIIFFDPPFGHNYIEYMQDRLYSKGWCSKNTQLMIRYNEKLPDQHKYWTLVRLNKIGKSFMHFFQLKEQLN